MWKNGWQIISPKKSFAVFASTPTEKAEWMAHINKCITDLLANSKLSDTINLMNYCTFCHHTGVCTSVFPQLIFFGVEICLRNLNQLMTLKMVDSLIITLVG